MIEMKALAAGMVAWLSLLSADAQMPGVAQKSKLIFADDFSQKTLGADWVVETAAEDSNGYRIQNGQLEFNTKGGITLWYRKKLSGNYLIEYDRTVVMNGLANDRLSDLNQFWMVSDPQQKMFTRKGGFREYDSLRMYYVGMGGNYNTTTRMRRYDGKGALQIVGEYTDSTHLLLPNKIYHVSISIKNGTTKFMVDGKEYFSFKDPEPLTEGWFAIRSTKSRQRIDNVRIYLLLE
jgi:hypothetical protein